jgi:hypothetical protein
MFYRSIPRCNADEVDIPQRCNIKELFQVVLREIVLGIHEMIGSM